MTGVVAKVAGRTRTFPADSVVLATGGLAVGGIVLERGELSETVFGLDVAAAPNGTPYAAEVHAENPIDRSGVAIDDALRPVERDGTAVHPNLYAAGGILAGAVPWHELSGNGLALATGLAAAGRCSTKEAAMDDMRGSLDGCVKCTVCETFCPVAEVTSLFPGPKYAGPQSERFRTPEDTVDASLDYCSGCGICTQVCPQDVHIAEINAQARAQMKAEHGMPLRDQIIARPTVLAALLTAGGSARQPLAGGAPVPGRAGRRTRHPPRRGAAEVRVPHVPVVVEAAYTAAAGNARKSSTSTAALPTVTIPGWAGSRSRCSSTTGSRSRCPSRVAAACRCSPTATSSPPASTCASLVSHLAPYARDEATIVATSTSCGLMLKREGREISRWMTRTSSTVGRHTFDICEFLLDLHERGELRTDFAALPLRVPYHQPCQGRGHGFGKPALDLLELIPELEVIEVDHVCCGVAGTYGLKKEKYEIAMQVGAPLFDDIRSANADLSACDSETCRWHIAKATDLPSVHPVELLHQAYGLADPG